MPSRLVAVLLLAPALLPAQSLPAYVPVSPVLASRSALYAQPFVPRHAGWRVSLVADYSNAIEQTTAVDRREFLFDAELLQVDLWLTRDLSPDWFVTANVAMRSAHDGMLDSFLNWYHDLIGLQVPARNRRPIDTYGWRFELPPVDGLPGRTIDVSRQGAFLGDLRLAAGRRIGPAQVVASVTLPTATNGVREWSRHTVGTALSATVRPIANDRVIVEGGLTAGYTPRHGNPAEIEGFLAAFQREWFVGGQAALRWRVIGQQAVFATLFMQSPSWQGTGFAAMDDPEFTIDFGGLIRLGEGWPALQLGMTEDLLPKGPAIDAGFKLGLHWGQ